MAYHDLQEYLTRLESADKLHWIEQRVDPAWEVTAVTRQLFDRYGWNTRPALGFRQIGVSEFPLVIGVIGGSPSRGQVLQYDKWADTRLPWHDPFGWNLPVRFII